MSSLKQFEESFGKVKKEKEDKPVKSRTDWKAKYEKAQRDLEIKNRIVMELTDQINKGDLLNADFWEAWDILSESITSANKKWRAMSGHWNIVRRNVEALRK